MRVVRPSARRSAVVALMSILTLLATALPAMAHHPEIDGDADCLLNGDVQVDWEAVAWSTSDTSARVHPTIEVQFRQDGGSWQDLAVGAYVAANGYSFGSDDSGFDPLTYSYGDSAPSTVQFRVYSVPTGAQAFNGQPGGTWGNGSPGGQTRTSRIISLPTDCEPPTQTMPPVPSGELLAECGSWSAPVSVAPLGQHQVADPESVTFQVMEGATVLGEVTLEPGEDAVLPGTFDEGSGDHDIVLLVAGAEMDTATVETDCEAAPAAEIGDVCAVDGIEVLLSNPDAPSAEFSVYSGEELVETVELSGTTEPYVVLVPADEGDTVDITVMVTGQRAPLLAAEITRDCEPPVVVAETCSPDGDLVVTATELPADGFFLLIDGESLDEPIFRSTAEPTSEWVEAFELQDGTYTIRLFDGTENLLYEQELVVDCDEPVVVVSGVECAEDGGMVVVTVDETPWDTFTATIGDITVDVIDGQATFTLIQDGTYTVLVTDSEGTVVHEEAFVVDCDEPVVVVASECDAEDGTVTVVITETPDEVFTVTVGDQSQQTTGGTLTFEGLEDGAVTVAVTSDHGYERVIDLTIACDDDTEVGGVVVETPRPDPAPEPEPEPEPAPTTEVKSNQLAATGVAMNLLVLSALMVLALGGALLGGSHRQGWQG